jgi:hypothetical protein
LTLFGFTQLEFPGTVSVADGRYVIRDGSEERVLAIETAGAPPPPRRRRRRSREAEGASAPKPLPLTRVTAIRAFASFDGEEGAAAWLGAAVANDAAIDELLAEGTDLLNRALHAHAVASADPNPQVLTPDRATTARIGYGSGEEVAVGDFTAAREVDAGATGSSRRRQRADELRPQARLAAVLGGREQIDVCELLLLRARADLDAGRVREAALQLRVGFEALLVELKGALSDPGHEEDMTALTARRNEVGDLANQALRNDLNPTQLNTLHELLPLCERVLRRRRILEG